jgi:hypothetical protein
MRQLSPITFQKAGDENTYYKSMIERKLWFYGPDPEYFLT